MYNDLFTIGPFTVHTYGLMIGIGIIVASIVADFRAKKKGLTESQRDNIYGLTIACVIFGLLFAKLLYIITVLPELIQGKYDLIDAIGNGWVIYGGLLGGILGAYLYAKWKKDNFWLYADIAMPAVALAQGFGRLGCFFAGCCYGVETNCSYFYLEFTNSAFAPNHVRLVPTQLIMSACDFALCIFLLVYEKKKKYRPQGNLIAWYLILYSLGRFLVEFWRGDMIRGQVGPLSTSQFIALFTLVAGFIFLFRLKKISDESQAYVSIFDPEKSEDLENAENKVGTESTDDMESPEDTGSIGNTEDTGSIGNTESTENTKDSE